MLGHMVCAYCGHGYLAESTKSYFTMQSSCQFRATGDAVVVNLRVDQCPSPECQGVSIWASSDYGSDTRVNNGRVVVIGGTRILSETLVPASNAKVIPEYVPNVIADDYRESCLIKNKSPKASATLARRCLQGMIRDFWGISKSRLVDEINDLKGKVDQQTWDAIDSLRQIGNIGAHMEKDIGLIVDVEADEADLLIELIETLIDDWYVARYERDRRMQKIKAISMEKAEQKKQIKPSEGE